MFFHPARQPPKQHPQFDSIRPRRHTNDTEIKQPDFVSVTSHSDSHLSISTLNYTSLEMQLQFSHMQKNGGIRKKGVCF